MSILEQTPGLLDALRGEMTPKFLATRSAQGIPNVVPCVSITPADDQPDTVFFGNFLLRKSIQNLKQDTRVGLLVITPELRGWRLKADFLEFQRTGPYVERQMSSSLLRYNAYTGVRDAGIIRVTSVEGDFAISKLQVARDYVLAQLAALGKSGDAGVTMPLAVRREFARMAAVKVLAWIGEDGYPSVIPALSLQPAGEKSLVCWKGSGKFPSPPPDAWVATNILTLKRFPTRPRGIGNRPQGLASSGSKKSMPAARRFQAGAWHKEDAL